jgi:hypothetical protein
VGFTITLNGEKIHEMDVDPRLVTGVRLMTAQGEAGVAGSSLNGVGSDTVGLIVDFQQSDTLPMVEDNARLEKSEAKAENEVTTYNENARREAAVEEVDAEYAKKAEDNPDEDYTEEYAQARADAVNPAAAEESTPKTKKSDKSEKADTEKADPGNHTPEKTTEKASASK